MNGYLQEVLEAQRVAPEVEAAVRARRAEIEGLLANGWEYGAPRFYYGGSFAKRTQIAAQFDLDVVVYFPPSSEGPRAVFEAVERRLRAAGHAPDRHNVALRLRYTPGWHVDVVPGRAVDATYKYARLWSAELDVTRQTSLKMHIRMAREGDREVIRLLKLWRARHVVPVGTFVLELAAARVRRGGWQAKPPAPLEARFAHVLRFLAEDFPGARLVDPANSNNVVTDEIEWFRKRAIADAAAEALGGPWERVVW